ncbi:complex I subunit 4 family protein [Longirhabdus pacifica]|uniref:complex I subunit 4 family protein n=1 Tax=Longirhabdus pacifica TaxID=2305227 RepID=UPI0010092D03|nr:NADH-quinone oxidoreductase subunit M [Longirhabdus pacifica]
MLESLPLLSLILFSPLIGVLILLFVPKHKRKPLQTIAILTTLIPLVLGAMLLLQFDGVNSSVQMEEELKWIQPLTYFNYHFAYQLGVDGISLPLILLTAFIATAAAFASVFIKKRWKLFFILLLLLETGIFGVFMARDLLLFFIFFEFTLVPMFFLIGIWGEKRRERAANYYLIYNGLGSAIMFIVFMMLIFTVGYDISTSSYTSSFDVIKSNALDPSVFKFDFEELKTWMFVLLLIAFGIKLPMFPFHTWVVKVHREAPPAVVMIHSGILLKMGAYGLIRFGYEIFPEQAVEWATVLAVIGVINFLYGALLALMQNELRSILAYSSISHMGIVLMGLAAGNALGMQGAVFQLISHGLISALLFLIVGSIAERTRTTALPELGGLAQRMPFLSGVFLFAGLASLGLPALSGFVAEFMSFAGLFEQMPVLAAIGSIGIVLAAVYMLRAVLAITFGNLHAQHQSLKDVRMMEAIPMVALTAVIIVLGVYPALLTSIVEQGMAFYVMVKGG